MKREQRVLEYTRLALEYSNRLSDPQAPFPERDAMWKRLSDLRVSLGMDPLPARKEAVR